MNLEEEDFHLFTWKAGGGGITHREKLLCNHAVTGGERNLSQQQQEKIYDQV